MSTTGAEGHDRPPDPPPAALPPDRAPRWVRRSILLLLAGVAGLYVLRHLVNRLQGLLVAILISLFLSFALEPAVNALARRGWRRGRATGAVMAAVGLSTVVFVVAVGSLVIEQVRTLIDRAPEYVDRIIDWVNRTFDTQIEAQDLIDRIQEIGLPEQLAGRTLAITTSVLSALFTGLTILLFTYYLTADGPRLRRVICSALPPDRQREVLRVWEVAIDKTGGYLYSRFLLAVLSSLFAALAFTLIGVPSPVPLALWVGFVSQFLPVVGTYLAGVLPVVVALVDDPLAALWVLGFVVVYQQVENYVFAPRITARTMELHPAVAFGAVLAGAALLGTPGALLALPAAASVQALASSYVERHEVIESNLTAERPPERAGRRVTRRARPADRR